MKHYHYIDAPEAPHRSVIEMDPLNMPGMPYGAIEWMYDPKSTEADFVSNRLEEIQPFVRNGILVIQGVFEAGTVISIALRADHVLQDISLSEMNELDELVVETIQPVSKEIITGMLYWIVVGQTGIFKLKAKVAQDKDGKIKKLRTNLKDIPLREYLARKARARTGEFTEAKHDEYPPVMDTKTAANYLRRSTSWLYGKAQDGVIPRTPDKRFRREDLDAYSRHQEERQLKRGRRRRR